jgi:outer membrane receptor protein involved in Fe transport
MTESNNLSALFTLPDSRSPTGYTTALVWTGNNAGLRPETAKSWSLGMDFTPPSQPNFSAAVTYFDFVFANRINETTDLPMDVLDNPALAWLVMPGASAGQQAEVCRRSQFIGLQSDCATAPIGALVDMRLRNIQTLKTNGVDITTRYQLGTPLGLFKYGLDSTYVLRYAQADTPTTPINDVRNTPHNPPGLKLRSSIEWDLRGLWLATFMNYQGGYHDPSSDRDVSSWTTIDATLGYTLKDGDSNSRGETRFSLRGLNIFNVNPPLLLDSIGLGYDHENADLLGRRVSISIQRRW